MNKLFLGFVFCFGVSAFSSDVFFPEEYKTCKISTLKTSQEPNFDGDFFALTNSFEAKSKKNLFSTINEIIGKRYLKLNQKLEARGLDCLSVAGKAKDQAAFKTLQSTYSFSANGLTLNMGYTHGLTRYFSGLEPYSKPTDKVYARNIHSEMRFTLKDAQGNTLLDNALLSKLIAQEVAAGRIEFDDARTQSIDFDWSQAASIRTPIVADETAPYFPNGYAACEKTNMTKLGLNLKGINLASFAAMKACEEKMNQLFTAELAVAVERKLGLKMAFRSAPSCASIELTGELLGPTFLSLRDGNLELSNAQKTQAVDFKQTFNHDLTVKKDRILKGRVVDAFGNVINPGVPYDTAQTTLQSSLKFQIYNGKSDIVLMDSMDFSRHLYERFANKEITIEQLNMMSCKQDLGVVETPVEEQLAL